MERYYQLLKVNFKYFLLKNLFLIVIMFLIAPFIMGMRNLDEIQTSKVLETYVSLFGIILLVPLLVPEEDKSIRELIRSKKESMVKIHLLRLFQEMVLLVISVFIFMILLRNGNCSFDFLSLFFDIMSICIFLGGLGILSFSIVNSQPFAYLIPIFYYIVSFVCGKDLLDKGMLLPGGVLMIILSIVVRRS